MRKEYNKLVRDRIPEIIQESGRECAVEGVSDSEYRDAPWQKLVEEATEAQEAAAQLELEGVTMELADLCEVMDAIMDAFDIQREAVLDVQRARREERGGFAKRLRLLWADRI
jgi:predicted house-cleaning noncanonical NTP pyrophosphatase (MazG superfamily)